MKFIGRKSLDSKRNPIVFTNVLGRLGAVFDEFFDDLTRGTRRGFFELYACPKCGHVEFFLARKGSNNL